MNTRKSSNGFGAVGIVVVLVVVVVIALTGLWVWKHGKSANTKSSTTNKQATTAQTKVPQTKTPTVDPYAGWKSYNNSLYGITFKYPAEWKVNDSCDENTKPPVNNIDVTGVYCGIEVDFDTNQKYADAVSIEISSDSIDKVSSFYDKYYQQPNVNNPTLAKTTNELKGKTSVQYIFTDAGVVTKHYLFSVGTKTYSFRSINEELNLQRSKDYWSNFDKVFDSLVIQ